MFLPLKPETAEHTIKWKARILLYCYFNERNINGLIQVIA